MNESFSTQASNFLSALDTSVDPRTGQFMINFPLASLVGNNQLGPELSLSLSYSPLNSTNSGFGTGFSLGLTQFNNKTNMLELSNGEKYRVMPGSDTVRNKKLDNFRFAFTNGNGDDDGYTVFWKEGKTEFLKKTEDGDTFVTTTILSPLGKKLTLSWDWSGQVSRLSKVRDESESALLCRIQYGFFPKVTLWPGTQDEYSLRFELLNDNQLDMVSLPLSESETLHWRFVYDKVDAVGLLLTGVNYPTGMRESVSYNQQLGLQYPNESGITTRLPAVESHTRTPGGGQPETITHYEYTPHNFLGYNSNFGDWSKDSDYIYTRLTDYEYGSTATVTSGDTKVTTTRRYNNYHLQIAEEVQRGHCIHRTQTEYHAKPWVFIDGQPPQFQLPKKQTETWRYTDNNLSRTQVTETDFDDNGNSTRVKAPDGTLTTYEFYPAAGDGENCPPELNGFVRFIKKQIITPRVSDYDDVPVSTTTYTYDILGEADCVVQNTESLFADNTLLSVRTTEYQSDTRQAECGRVTAFIDTLYENGHVFTCRQDFNTVVHDGLMTQTVTFTGHDGVQVSSVREQSLYSGLLLSETDAYGVTITHSYDKIGRLLSQTVAPGTDYQNTTTWAYSIDDKGPVTLITDAAGNQRKTCFDGMGRNIRLYHFDRDGKLQWFEVASYTYNAFGEAVTSTGSDWLTSASEQYSVKMSSSTDGWGNISAEAFSDGTKNHLDIDPVALTSAVYAHGETSDQSLSSGKLTTRLDPKSQLPLTETSTDISGKEQSVRNYVWDGAGRLRKETDERDHSTRRTYDARGRLLTQTLADGSVVTRTYAPHLTGEQVASISVTGPDADGNTQTWLLGTQAFDSLGRVTKHVSGGRCTLYSYEGATPEPSQVTLPSGNVIQYSYIPELGNVVSRVEADGVSQVFSYDASTGELLKAEEGNSATKQRWNPSGSLKDESFTQDGTTHKAAYTRTLAGSPVTYTDITGAQTTYTRDVHGRVTKIMDSALTVTLLYDAIGRLSIQTVTDTATQSKLTTTLTYDDFGRETTRTVSDSRSGGTLRVSQTWLENGLQASRTTVQNATTVRNEKYEYDVRNRLIGYTSTGSSLPVDAYGNPFSEQVYNYDALNNLTVLTTTLADGRLDTATYHYENNNDPTQLTSVQHTDSCYPPVVSLKYDAGGRMVLDESGRTLSYDVIGRLNGVSGEGTPGGSYGYDALNRLVSQSVSSHDRRQLFYRGDELVNEVLTQQKRQTRLIKSGHICLGVSDNDSLTLIATDRNDSLLWSRETGQSQGSLHTWAPYGSGETTEQLPGFNGERPDPVSGTYHLGNGYRAYNPVLMRFNCPDDESPFGVGGINPYAYCAGDPVNHTDPSGHISWQGIVGIVAGVIGIGLAVFTGGASIAAAGGVMSAINSASATALVLGSLEVVSDVTAIASDATEDSDPHASSILGWVSMATGLTGMGLGIGKGVRGALKSRRNYDVTGAAGKMRGQTHNYPLAQFDTIDDVKVKPLSKAPKKIWHTVKMDTSASALGGKQLVFGANRPINCESLHQPLKKLARRNSVTRRPITILTGSHGVKLGYNWVDTGNAVIRDPRILEKRFYREDLRLVSKIDEGKISKLEPLAGRRFNVVDMDGMHQKAFRNYITDPANHVILAYCFGRNDNLFRHIRDLKSVISYG